jgi:CheY-like chemotaxis protein
LPSANTAAVESRNETSAAASPGGTETILVVEDDVRVRRVALARLRNLGYKVVEASNAAEALAQLDVHKDIALLFTDVVMSGGISGDELAQQAQRKAPDLKVLLTSGYAAPEIAVRELARSGSWLRKPYRSRELAILLRSLLDEEKRIQ